MHYLYPCLRVCVCVYVCIHVYVLYYRWMFVCLQLSALPRRHTTILCTRSLSSFQQCRVDSRMIWRTCTDTHMHTAPSSHKYCISLHLRGLTYIHIHTHTCCAPFSHTTFLGLQHNIIVDSEEQSLFLHDLIYVQTQIKCMMIFQASQDLQCRQHPCVSEARSVFSAWPLLHAHLHTCTKYFSSFRLSTIRNADNIIVFQKGEVVEQGPHAELVKIENGFYKELVSKQMMQVLYIYIYIYIYIYAHTLVYKDYRRERMYLYVYIYTYIHAYKQTKAACRESSPNLSEPGSEG